MRPLRNAIERCGGIWLNLAAFPFPYRSALNFRIDYDRYDPQADLAPVVAKCPREMLIYVGKPSDADLAAVAAEELPARVEAEPETTVDKTQWRG